MVTGKNKRKPSFQTMKWSVKLSIAILCALYFTMIFAGFFAPYSPLEQNPQAGYASPVKLHFDGIRPYIYEQNYFLNELSYKKESREIKENGGGRKYYLKFFQNGKLLSVDRPAYFYLLGTDKLGRDLLSRIIHGARPSLSIGFIGLLIAFPIGIFYGACSGFFSGAVDNVMMRIAEAIMSLPSFYLLIILSSLLPPELSNVERFTMITFILSFISWAGLARIVRGQILSIREKEFIESAKTIGQDPFMIIIKHLVPHTMSFLVVAMTLSVPSFIIGESALSFLGLGINQPDPSWGNILAEGKDLSNIMTRPCMLWTPSLLIFFTVFSFNILGDFLRDWLDPKSG